MGGEAITPHCSQPQKGKRAREEQDRNALERDLARLQVLLSKAATDKELAQYARKLGAPAKVRNKMQAPEMDPYMLLQLTIVSFSERSIPFVSMLLCLPLAGTCILLCRACSAHMQLVLT